MNMLCAGVTCADLRLVEPVNVAPIDLAQGSLWAVVVLAFVVAALAWDYLTRDPRKADAS